MTDKKIRFSLYEERMSDAVLSCFDIDMKLLREKNLSAKDKVQLALHIVEFLRKSLYKNEHVIAEILVKLGLEDFDNVYNVNFTGVH